MCDAEKASTANSGTQDVPASAVQGSLGAWEGARKVGNEPNACDGGLQPLRTQP